MYRRCRAVGIYVHPVRDLLCRLHNIAAQVIRAKTSLSRIARADRPTRRLSVVSRQQEFVLSEYFPNGNRILPLLRTDAQEFLLDHALTRAMHFGEVIFEPTGTLSHAVFPHSGQVSLIATREDGRIAEQTALGPEGMIGLSIILGGGSALNRSVTRIPGVATWIPAHVMTEALQRFPCLYAALILYARSLILQLMESVSCNSLGHAPERVARWLLHAHDAVHGDTILITQESLAEALGLRRATVNAVCTELARDGIITYTRGKVIVLDRAALEARASDAYARIAASYHWQAKEVFDSLTGLQGRGFK